MGYGHRRTTKTMALSSWLALSVLTLLSLTCLFLPYIVRICGQLLGSYVKDRTAARKQILLSRAMEEKKRYAEDNAASAIVDEGWEKIDRSQSQSNGDQKTKDEPTEDWSGIVGFFHPFCNAGGGGERVLWAALRATQQKWPNALCVVYTGDHEVTKEQILDRVKERFNIQLYPPTIAFLYLSTRRYVLSTTWPHFTLMGQSLGSLVVGLDAFNLVVPDIFIDTMGYAFTHALCKFLFPKVPVGAYVHYPTISTDMLGSLNAPKASGRGLNAGAGEGFRGQVKRWYWHLFARIYGWVGGCADVVMANSSWTGSHIRELWGPTRKRRNKEFPIDVVFPPTAVDELENEIEVSAESEKQREPTLLYIAQFRPEKNHQLILRSFAKLLQTPADSGLPDGKKPKLLLIGSVRNDTDETYIYSLRLLAHELRITNLTTFVLNATWPTILTHLRTASVGVNGMWNEHFGIGVVEYQAAGLISVVHDSGGPKLDIVVDEGQGPTGYHATTETDFARGFGQALSLPPREALAMRKRARQRAKKFSEEAFDQRWVVQMQRLVNLQTKKR